MITEDQKIRVFKATIQRRALRLGLVLLFAVAIAMRRNDVTFGLLFGLCVGFINFNLMCWQTERLIYGQHKGSERRAVLSFLSRYAILAAAGVAVWWKEFQPLTALVGFLVVQFTLVTYEFVESMKRRFLSVEKSS